MTPKQLKKIRSEFGMSMREFGEHAGYSFTGIGKMENEQLKIPERMVNTLKTNLEKKIENLKKLVDTL